jgi:hypothetical protein
MSKQLNGLKVIRGKVVEGKLPGIEQIALQNKYDYVNDQEVPDHGGYIKHAKF